MYTDIAKARHQLADRLRARRTELERAIATRVYSISPPRKTNDPEYTHGLRASLSTAVDYAISAIELGEQRSAEIPSSLLAQARMAARNGIGLETVLRRYLVGYSMLTEYVLAAAGEADLPGQPALQGLLKGQAAVFDSLVESVSEEYGMEAARLNRSPERRRFKRVRRLLGGELLDTSELAYEFDAWHIGLVLCGGEGAKPLAKMAERLDRCLLAVADQPETHWAWLGGRGRVDSADVVEVGSRLVGADSCLAVGEPAHGLEGWRLTHQQAKRVTPLARLVEGKVVRYADAGLLASIAYDDVLTRSIRQIYLDPLADEPDGGEALYDTLQAYLTRGRNVTSAAAALDVNRETVRNRLRNAEKKLGRSLDECAAELEIALRLKHYPLMTPSASTLTPPRPSKRLVVQP